MILTSKILLRSYYPIISLVFDTQLRRIGSPANLSKTVTRMKSQKICCIAIYFSQPSSSCREVGFTKTISRQMSLLYPFGYSQIMKRHGLNCERLPSNQTRWVQFKALGKVSKWWFGNHWKTPFVKTLSNDELSDYGAKSWHLSCGTESFCKKVIFLWVFGKWWPESERFAAKKNSKFWVQHLQ